MAESGIPDQESDTLSGHAGPFGTPVPIIDLLHKEIVKAIADPTISARLIELGFDPVGNTPAQFAVLIREEIEKWGKVIRAANMKVE